MRLPSGMAQRYQEMAKRGQYFTRLAERLNLTPTELDEHLIRNAIGDAEHKMLLSRDDQQRDLFQEAA